MGPLGLGLSTFLLGVTSNPWIQTTARSMQGVSGGNMGKPFFFNQTTNFLIRSTEATKAVITEVCTSFISAPR